jgi:hypothetical protein
MKHKVGQLVLNNKLGLGKVLEVRGDTVTVYFKDQSENPRIINVAVVPMTIAKDQADPCFDEANMPKKLGKKMPARKRATRQLTGIPGQA